MAALDIALDTDLALRSDQIVCYAIAAPRVGNHAFARAYDAAVPHTWNIINDQVKAQHLRLGIYVIVLLCRSLEMPFKSTIHHIIL